jgi:hypothetical protein
VTEQTEQAYNGPWAPNKPEDEYMDPEIRETRLFKTLQAAGTLPDETVLRLTREHIKEMWKSMQKNRFSDVIVAVFTALDDAGIERGSELTIKMLEDGSGIFDKPKGKTRKRFGPAKHAMFINGGTPKDSPLYREAVKALEEKCGLDASALRGGYLVLKTQMRTENKNGVFELVIGPGIPGNEVTDAFTAKLYQYPFVEQAVPVISHPPVSGKKRGEGALITNDEITEVGSMSQMCLQSCMATQMTPAVMFGLDKMVVEKPGEVPAPAKAAPKAAATKTAANTGTASAAHKFLDDDDDEE